MVGEVATSFLNPFSFGQGTKLGGDAGPSGADSSNKGYITFGDFNGGLPNILPKTDLAKIVTFGLVFVTVVLLVKKKK